MGLVEALALLAKYGPEIWELVRVLEDGKVTRDEATEVILKLEREASDAEMRREFPGQG